LILLLICVHLCASVAKSFLYLVRHGATAANLAVPARLQGRNDDPPLAPFGIREAEATRDLLSRLTFAAVYCSPLRRAAETADIVAAPHRLTPVAVPDLTECDVGTWQGLDWETIRQRDPVAYQRYMADPGTVPYPGGESFADVHKRTAPVLDRLMREDAGQSILVVSHHVVLRTYLAGLLGLSVRSARRVSLDNCGVSLVTSEDGKAAVVTLNAILHLPPVPAGVSPA
jgi:broad specificity phosphatase PhoE